MNIDGPFYIQELIYTNPLLRKFTSKDNVSLLQDIIFEYINNNNIQLKKINITLEKIAKIISHFAGELINEISIKNNIEKYDLVKLNKYILKNIIIFFKKHKENLDVFDIYINDLNSRKKITEYKNIEKQLNNQTNDLIPSDTFLKNDFTGTNVIENNITNTSNKNNIDEVDYENTKLNSLSQQLTRLSNKYNTNILDNLVIEKVDNPENKFLITRINDTYTETKEEINESTDENVHNTLHDLEGKNNILNCINCLKDAILNNNIIEQNIKKNTEEIINILLVN